MAGDYQWLQYSVAFVTATFAPLVKDWIVESRKKSKISAAILGAKLSSEGPRHWRVHVIIRNEGTKPNVLLVAYLNSKLDDPDPSRFALKPDEHGNPIIWSYPPPVLIGEGGGEALDLLFWVGWENVPSSLELRFTKGPHITIKIDGNPLVESLFTPDSIAAAATLVANKVTHPAPVWVYADCYECHCRNVP